MPAFWESGQDGPQSWLARACIRKEHMEKKRYLAALIVAAIIFVASLAIYIWFLTTDASDEIVLTGPAALQYGYILCLPLMVGTAVFAAAISIVHFAKLHIGRIAKTVLLILGILFTALVVVGPLVAAFLPEALQILVVACVLVAARYAAVMIVPACLLGFGLAPVKDKVETKAEK